MADADSIDLDGYEFKPFPKNRDHFNDVSGKKFTRLQVVGYLGGGKWLCRCDCGILKRISSAGLLCGDHKSCGCKKREDNRRFWEPIDYGNGVVGIPLNRGLVALIDAADLPLVQGRAWTAWKSSRSNTHYAKCTNPRFRQHLHRVIMDAPKRVQVDHRNGNGLDNRRSNLRLCNNSQNQRNTSLRRDNKAGYKGVYFRDDPMQRPWVAHIRDDGKQRTIGYFFTAEEAAKAYDAEAIRLFGEFARLNFPA